MTCFRCGEGGHYASECGNLEAVPNCFNCRKPGHFARNCKAPRAEPAATAA
ncbi:cellular nucleic acid-binding protein [Trifolium medium]|uniref:Cellular nucleic acid-binding protein n=1 Tax=Trifolium medium TaxID=97028 RepID=A0A392VIB2_9FABA|nr:cellular nucleic acid-binding protein [Trifolium medium]